MNILISFIGPFRAMAMAIDGVAFSLLDNAYNVVMELSTAEFLQHESIKSITESIYILVGVVAFFRLALVLVNAIIDPEKLNEKGKGLSNIFFRVVGMIIILAVTPFLFQMSYELQGKIVGLKNSGKSENIIFKTILGDKANMGGANAGKALQNIALSSLITVNDEYVESFTPLECVPNNNGTCTNQGGYVYDDSNGKCDWDNCKSAISVYNDMYVNEDMSPVKLGKYAGVSKKIDGEEIYVYNYLFLITTFVGGFMTYIIISFAIDIAVRMFELVVLEVLSPLFIATFVDPKSAQSGPFKNWLSAVGKSYANLYIKLAILALTILLISFVNQSHMFQDMDASVSGFAKIITVIGLLIFAKKAPKWIMDMIGIKGDESGLGGLSIGKKLGGMALAGGLVNKGLESGKKALGNKAKRVGAGMFNRLGADIGGTLAGRKSAKRNALGDKSLRSIRENKLNETGSKAKANAAMLKSFFSSDDRKGRRDELKKAKADGSLNLKDAGKEGRMFARVEATNAALDGNFKTAGALGKSTKANYDPGFKTHDERLQADAAARLYANQGAFNMAEINRQKKIREDLAESAKILGQQTFANDDGDIFIDSDKKIPAIYNEKTIKKYAGEGITDYTSLGANIALGKNAVINDNERTLNVATEFNTDGTIKETAKLVVPKNTLLREIKTKDAEGNEVIAYASLGNKSFKDEKGTVVDVATTQLDGKYSRANIEATSSGIKITDKVTGNLVYSTVVNTDGSITINGRNGETDISKIMKNYAMEIVGKSDHKENDSVLAKQLDAAFASLKEKNAENIVKFEADIGNTKKQKIELQTKFNQQQEQILQLQNNTQYGMMEFRASELQKQQQIEKDRLSQLTDWLSTISSSASKSIMIDDIEYTEKDIRDRFEETKKKIASLSEESSSISNWFGTEEANKAKTQYDNLKLSLEESLSIIREQIEDTNKSLASLEVEKNKISKDVNPLQVKVGDDWITVSSETYNTVREQLSKDTEKFAKIAEGAIGQAPSNKKD